MKKRIAVLQSVWEDVKREYRYGNMITQLVIANTAVFIVINLFNILNTVFHGFEPNATFQTILKFFVVSSDWIHDLTRPWTIITHMFVHVGFFHFLFNMLFLYWFGRIVQDFIGNEKVLPLYLMGGLAGFVAFFFSANFIYGGTSIAYGASAAVMALTVASGVLAPDYEMRLILIGNVKLKYIVLALVLLDLIGIGNNINTGGHFAHLGGAFTGWLYITRLREGVDWAKPVNRIIDAITGFFSSLFSGKEKRSPLTVSHKKKEKTSAPHQAPKDKAYQERLDMILEKIKASGYESLTKDEKEFLFHASKK